MVKLQIRLKEMTHAATSEQIFAQRLSPRPWGGGQNINSPLIQNLVMLPIKFKRMANAATHKHIF